MMLRATIWLASLIPVSAGLAGALGLLPEATSHARYLSGLLLGIGLGLAWAAFDLPRRAWLFDAFVPLVILGGLARLLGLLADGPPPWPHLPALGMELLVTPLLWAAVRRAMKAHG